MKQIAIDPKLLTVCGLTEEQYKRFSDACWSTYSSIGGDLAELDGGRDQLTQIEVILDADYVRMYGHQPRTCSLKEFQDFYDNMIRPMFNKHYGKPHFIKMMKTIFPHSYYE